MAKAANPSSLDSAFKGIKHFSTVPLTHEPMPNIEAGTVSVTYGLDYDLHFKDANLYTDLPILSEATLLSQLDSLIIKGKEYSCVLYTMRSTAKALGAVSKSSDPAAVEIASKEVLEPVINNLMACHKYCDQAISKFAEVIDQMIKLKVNGNPPSETLMHYMAKLLDQFTVLDSLKSMKRLLTVDCSIHKRFTHNLQNMDIAGQQVFQAWLATHNAISNTLKEKLVCKEGFEEVMCDIVNLSADMLESGQYITPEEKYTLLKSIAVSMFLTDAPANKKNKVKPPNVFKLKNLTVLRLFKLFKASPVVPLFGDMWMPLMSYFELCPNYQNCAPPEIKESNDKTMCPDVFLALQKAKQDHDHFLSELQIEMTLSKNGDNLKDMNDDIIKGFKMISSWTALLQEWFSWKLYHPSQSSNIPEGAEHYEKAVRYNFSPEEKYAFIEFIAMIKGASAKLASFNAVLGISLRTRIHKDIQFFIQLTLRDMIRALMKKKKKNPAADLLKEIRKVLAHWKDGIEPDDPAMRGEKDPKNTGTAPTIVRAAVPGTYTQIYIARSLLEPLAKGYKTGIMKASDFSHENIKEIQNFCRISFFYEHIIDFNSTLFKCSDLSQFWFREYHLELTRGECIQFPIAMSLPWILTDQVLEKQNHAMMEYIFYPLDLYNDSANYCLRFLKCQYLYNEIEAEANLSFDQLIFKLAQSIHSAFKQTASSIILDKGFKRDLVARGIRPSGLNAQGSRYATILKQRHIQLLGRMIDLNKLLTERINFQIRRSIELGMTRFESGDFTSGIIELEMILQQIRLTHSLLSEFLLLDPFDQMFQEVNENMSPKTFNSRIVQHVFYDLAVHFLPNYCYNSATRRFYMTKLSFTDPDERSLKQLTGIVGTKAFAEVFAALRETYGSCCTTAHLSALVRIIGEGQVAVLIEELLQNTRGLITGSLMPFVSELMKGLPPNTKLPTYELGSQGAFMVFQLSLNPIITYRDLKPVVLHHFRELGNTMILIHLLEQCLYQEQSITSVTAAPFSGSYLDSETKGLFTQINEIIGANQPAPNGTSLSSCYTPMKTGSIFKKALLTLQEYILELTDWKSPYPRNGVMEVDGFPEFYRLWSAVQYCYCTPSMNPNEYTMEMMFGEGVLWGGLSIVRLLEQHYRFNAFDFSYHIMKVNEYDNNVENCNGVNLGNFVENTKKIKLQNDAIIGIFDKVLDVSHGCQVFHPLIVTSDEKIQPVPPTTENPGIATPLETDPKKNFQNIAEAPVADPEETLPPPEN